MQSTNWRWFFVSSSLIFICVTQSGCIAPIMQLIQLPFNLLNQAMGILNNASNLPVPPGVF